MTAIQIVADDERLLLVYSPEESRWVFAYFESKRSVHVRHTFEFTAHHLLRPSLSGINLEAPEPEEEEFVFTLGMRVGEYFRIDPEVVHTANAFYFHESIPLEVRHFVAERNISILRKIDDLVQQDVYVGGLHPEAMPAEAYMSMLDHFPTSYELMRYSAARVGSSVADYFETTSDTALLYEKYMNKRLVARTSDIADVFKFQEIAKFQTLMSKLEGMLANQAGFNERSWQNEILEIIRLLYPKYILVIPSTRVPDYISGKSRQLDLMLVDASGHVDLIEIKRPFDNCVVSRRRYRDNYPPAKELTGAVMQTEKYILHLNKWGRKGEEELNRRYADRLPSGLRLRITNPKGIIIMGRDHNLNPDQRADFEVIKRKYSNMIDIITYDDLLARLGFVIAQLGVHSAGESSLPKCAPD